MQKENKKKVLIVSTSAIYGSSYLEYILPEVKKHFANKKQVLFVPFARPSGISHDEYTKLAKDKFATIGIDIKGIHEFQNMKEAIHKAEGIFVGGGNTFLLVKQLHDLELMYEIKEAVEKGCPYMGTSAGANITGISMQTTNDMPIVYPKSFLTLRLVNFNLNPHYLDPDPNSTHKGETRETRIKEFLTQNDTPVVGLREGSWILVDGDVVKLQGKLKARVFEKGKEPYEIDTQSLIKF